jgi:sigma-E factor negative regulatory protein RseC
VSNLRKKETMSNIGVVSEVGNDYAIVDVRRASACGDNCASCGGGCDIPVLKIKIDNVLSAGVGDFVELEARAEVIMKSTFIMYGLPLITFVIGVLASDKVLNTIYGDANELYTALVGFILMALTYMAIKINSKEKETFLTMSKIIDKI